MIRLKLVCIAMALAVSLGCLTLGPPTAEATVPGFIEDMNSPDATYRDAAWHNNGEFMVAVGNNSLGNGVVDKYYPGNETWQPIHSLAGETYNGIANTEAFMSFDGFEEGTNGWTVNTWETEAASPLVGRWKFDDGVGLIANDTSDNDNHGSLINMDNTNWVGGMSGKALRLNGIDECVNVLNVPGLTSGGSFSGSCWINFTAHTNFGGIVNKYSIDGWGLWDQTDGKIRFWRSNDGNNTFRDSSIIPAGKWHHIAWIYNVSSGIASFYIDGRLDYTQASVNPGRDISTMTVGKYSTYFLNGQIDELCIYDYALTTKEISDYYNETVHRMGEWHFDENTGGIAYDTSQNDFNGALMPTYPTNSPQWVEFSVSGSTLFFDGVDDAVETDYIPNTFDNHDFTIEAWIYPTISRSDMIIYAVGAANAQDQAIEFKINTDTVSMWYWMDNWDSNVHVNINEWTRLTYTHSSSTKVGSIYVNGIFSESHLFAANPNVFSDAYIPSQIGHGIETRCFKGCIDEFSIYNYTMPADAVSRSYNEYVMNYFQNESRHLDMRFNEGSGATAYDSGIHENHGTLLNMEAEDWVPGISGSALSFDGLNEYVSCGNDASFDITDSGTVEAWVYPRAEDNFLRLVSKGNNYELSMDSSYPHKWNFWVNGGQSVTSASDVRLNAWTHIAATFDGASIRIYINGIEENAAPRLGILSPDISAFEIGHGSGYYFNGTIDEVRVWNRAFTSADVLASYNSMLNPQWVQVDPSALPTPDSGISHGTAKNGNSIWWFGVEENGDYSDGTRVAGSLVSPTVQLPSVSSVAAIVFSHWFDVESGGNYDRMIVSVKNTSDTGWYELKRWDSSNQSFSDWRQEVIQISGWLGNQVQVNFTFDSVDAEGNGHAGWHIDDFVLYTNEMYILVGEPGPSMHPVHAIDAYGTYRNIAGMDGYHFNDVAPGNSDLSFMAVGDSGAVFYFDGFLAHALSGPNPGDVLTGVDFNGTHFFVVGYDSTGHGVAYYYAEYEFYAGQNKLHTILGTPDWKLNAVSWSNTHPGARGGYGIGAVAAEGSAMSFSDPEIWYRIQTPTAPSTRTAQSMAYDPENDIVMLFGGFNGGNLGDTWIYHMTTQNWVQVFPATAPSARANSEMVFDTFSQKFILFGGYPYSDETWAYDYPTNTWTKMNPASKPSARCYHAMVFDTVIGQSVLFGGYDTGGAKYDTWTYDYQTDAWIPKAPMTSPTARNNHAMAFDTENGKTVMFGGQTGGYNDETWVYDAVADTWEQKFPTIKPSARLRHAMAYDPISGRVLMFGGNAGGTLSDQTWAYDLVNNKWTDLFPNMKPAVRAFSEMAYASRHGKMVMFGGDYTLGLNDTWHLLPGTPWNGNVVDPAKYTNGENFTAVTWNNAGTDAFFVGHNSTHAVLYTFYQGSDYIAIVPGTGDVFAGHELYAAACKPNSKTGEFITLGASSFKVYPNMFDSSTMLTVNVDFPHIFALDFREQSSGTSKLDSQVDVGNNYTFFVEGNYTAGGLDMWNSADITIDAWFDEGKTGTNSAPDGTWATEENRTRQFRITHDLDTGTTSLNYPNPALEFTLHSTWEDPAVYPGQRHRIYINVSFKAQTRVADGQGFAAGPPTSGNIWSVTDAWNDPDSWDFRIRLEDAVYSSSFAESYGEFGVKTFVALSASGNPAVNAPPGTADNPMSPFSQITYSSNADYWVDVSIPHLYLNGNILLESIGAWNVSVRNLNALAGESYISSPTHFPSAENVAMNVWGLNATSIQAPGNGTVSRGPDITNFNSASAYTELEWWITVQAGVSEGVYWAQITLTIRTS